MGFRFFRRMKIAPGVSLNFSRSGISPSLGVRGARVTLGRTGIRKTVGIPGTGLFYTQVSKPGRKTSSTRRRTARSGRTGPAAARTEPPRPVHTLERGFFERLTTPKAERAFVEGCKAYVSGKTDEALGHLERADSLADGAFLAGFLQLNANQLDRAAAMLKVAIAEHRHLNTLFAKYGLAVGVGVPITEELTAYLEPTLRDTMLGLAEVHQLQGRIDDAIVLLKRLHTKHPSDALVRLSLCELLLERSPGDRATARKVVGIAGDVANESEVHAGLMLFKGQALRTLGLDTAARDTLTAGLRRTKDRSDGLLRAMRYERALVYEALGQHARSRSELETLFAVDPEFEDVAERLGV